MAIPPRDLEKVADVPEVRAAIEARDAAGEASRQAYQAWKATDLERDRRQYELDVAATRALEALRQEA
jgi:hypothetical protein